MSIIISATFPSDEYIHILATQKGYQETITAITEDPESTETIQVQNPQSKEDFLRQVYEGIILNDASTEIIRFNNQMKEKARIAEENAIREAVASSITSSVGN